MTEIKTEVSDLRLRYELARDRIREIPDDTAQMKQVYLDFFVEKSKYISYALEVFDGLQDGSVSYSSLSYDELESINNELYKDILGSNYDRSYSNPDFAEKKLGVMGRAFSYISAELQGLPGYIYDGKTECIVYLLELFLEIYLMFGDDTPKLSDIEKAIYYYAFDYIEFFAYDRMCDSFIPERGTAYQILEDNSFDDPEDVRYLYGYGEYISDTEISLAKHLASMDDEKLDKLSKTFTDGFRRGFDMMNIDFTGKNSVCIRYHIGQERIVKRAMKYFDEMGLKTIIMRYALNRGLRKGVIKQGFEGKSPNMQFEFDHRNDDYLFLDSRYADRRINAAKKSSEKLSEYFTGFAGPAVIESFGEELFSPVVKESAAVYSDEQQALKMKIYGKLGEISNEFLPGDSYSFSIIAFPLPDIGDDFSDIFEETAEINSLDNAKYVKIQQSIIDVLDTSETVHVEGMNDNRTDMTVQMRHLEDPKTQTQFENCTADVNIPLGEVFTSPVLKGTNGVLNVSGAYLNGYFFKDIELVFKDGVVTDYSCKNFDDESKGKQYIKDNILFSHDFLPLGEFAIGTNTLAYSMARKYNILEKLPILIVEKTGPHFAVGDTCYSHAEDHAVFNPDGKEIVSRENDFSLLRDTEPEKAYFNCHTDITIPYNELGRLYAVDSEGNETDIIVNGRFVLPGTEELNKALD